MKWALAGSAAFSVFYRVYETSGYLLPGLGGSPLLAAVLGLLCRYFRRAKAVSDDNESII